MQKNYTVSDKERTRNQIHSPYHGHFDHIGALKEVKENKGAGGNTLRMHICGGPGKPGALAGSGAGKVTADVSLRTGTCLKRGTLKWK